MMCSRYVVPAHALIVCARSRTLGGIKFRLPALKKDGDRPVAITLYFRDAHYFVLGTGRDAISKTAVNEPARKHMASHRQTFVFVSISTTVVVVVALQLSVSGGFWGTLAAAYVCARGSSRRSQRALLVE